MFSPSADERLDAPRRLLPGLRRPALLRAAAVAALLCLAAGVLFLDGPRPAPVVPPPSRASAAVPVTPPPPTAPAGTVGLPLRLADAGVVAVVRVGQRVDVLADGRVLATDVLVLRAIARGEAPEEGALLYLAVTAEQAARVAAVRTDTPITVTVRAP